MTTRRIAVRVRSGHDESIAIFRIWCAQSHVSPDSGVHHCHCCPVANRDWPVPHVRASADSLFGTTPCCATVPRNRGHAGNGTKHRSQAPDVSCRTRQCHDLPACRLQLRGRLPDTGSSPCSARRGICLPPSVRLFPGLRGFGWTRRLHGANRFYFGILASHRLGQRYLAHLPPIDSGVCTSDGRCPQGPQGQSAPPIPYTFSEGM